MAFNHTQKTNITADVLAVIAEIQPCTSEEVWRRGFPTFERARILRSVSRLSCEKRITRITPSGQQALYTTTQKPMGIQVLPKEALAPVKMKSNTAPARTYHTVETYRATNWRMSMPLRPGALDHEKHPSLRAGVRVPYAPAVLTIQGGRR